MSRMLFRTLVLLLPLIGLGGLWGWTHDRAQQGTIWEVPVTGYDPADLLRGHYIRYRYQWPGSDKWPGADDSPYVPYRLCITGNAPVILSAAAPISMDYGQEKPCSQLVRASSNTQKDVDGLQTGILYVSQDRAKALEKQLADPKLQGILMFRARDDGIITPIDMRFRPLTAEELKRREERARIN
jgi:hypothetical protein